MSTDKHKNWIANEIADEDNNILLAAEEALGSFRVHPHLLPRRKKMHAFCLSPPQQAHGGPVLLPAGARCDGA